MSDFAFVLQSPELSGGKAILQTRAPQKCFEALLARRPLEVRV